MTVWPLVSPWPQGRAEHSSWLRPLSGTPRFPPVCGSPVLGAVQGKNTTQTGLEHVEHEGSHPHQGADNQRDGDDHGEYHLDNRRSIRPGTAVPPTLLVADMGDGSLFLQGSQDGPTVYLSPSDAVSLRRELAAAFGSADLTPSDDQGDAL